MQGNRSASKPNADEHPVQVDVESLRRLVDSYFTPQALGELMGRPRSETERIARGRLAQSPRRQALVAAAAFHCCKGISGATGSEELRRVAVALECFQCGWAVHSEIQAGSAADAIGKALHQACGAPIAINAGDFLFGEGYRMIAEARLPAETKAAMLHVAAAAHRQMTVARGAQLRAANGRQAPPLVQADKVPPDVQVALRLGALCAGADAEAADVLRRCPDLRRIIRIDGST
ncbi:MAG: polyprenyl synthetase family protein [Planctomycetota bacterium]|jgi:hypothetical protein